MDRIKISVGELIRFVMRSGDIDNSFFRKDERMKQGIAIHQKIQRDYGPDYKKEVVLRNETVYQEILFEVRGRADGIYKKGDEVMIDEIKSTTRPLDSLDYDTNPMHWAQVKTYGYFYCEKYDLDALDLQCTYCHVESHKIKTIRKTFTRDELKAFYLELLSLYLAFSKQLVEFKKLRDRSIDYLAFPYPKYRRGQREMAVAVYQSIRRGKDILLEAPTGIGKTMSTLFPSIKALGHFVEKIFYLTSKTSIKEACHDALFLLSSEGLRIKSCTLTAKEKLCINNEVKCNPVDCPYAKGHFDRVNDCIMDIYENEDLFLPEIITKYAEKHRVCPVELQFDLSSYSDIVIGDYNYVFDPIVYLRRFFEETLDPYVFLVDEAHNLVDRGRDMYSKALSSKAIRQVMSYFRMDEKEEKLYMNLMDILMILQRQVTDYVVEDNVPKKLPDALQKAMKSLENFLYDRKEHEHYDEVLELYFSFYRFLKVFEYYSEDFKTIIERKDDDTVLEICCLDPSSIFRGILTRAVSTVFFSATLTPMDYYGEIFGLKDHYKGRLPSPFDSSKLEIGIVPLSTKYRDRMQNLPDYRKILEVFLEAEGNSFIFFPSYAFMKQVLDGIVIKDNYFVQRSFMTRRDRAELLSHFTEDSDSKAFLVLGGSFSESIDLTGDKLVQTLIFSVGLPGVDIRRNLIKEHFDQKNNRGFDYAYIYPGMNKVAQAAGRVIRTKKDRGKVLLVDDRFVQSPYNALMPGFWRRKKVLSHINSIKAFMKKVNEDEKETNR